MYKIIKIIIQVYFVFFKNCKIILSFFIFFIFLFYFLFVKIYLNKINFNKMFFKDLNSILIFNFIQKNNLNIYNFANKKFLFKNKYLNSKKDGNIHIVNDLNNLICFLVKIGLNIKDIIFLSDKYDFLNKIKVGQKLIYTNDENYKLIKFKLFISEHEKWIFYKQIKGDFFYRKKYVTKGIWIEELIQGTIVDNFIKTAFNVGLNKNEVYECNRVLQYQFNLKRLKNGDKFVVLLNREIFEGSVRKSKLLAIRLLTKKKNYYAFKAKNGNYYDCYGNSLKNLFLSSPTLKRFRISSHFSFNRVNPVTGIKTPHNGVDFSMPNGTPVLSVADGKVIAVKYNYFAGNFIVIRHNNDYVTRYMHLRNFVVKKNQIVKKGDIIAFSGSTGRVTGPHLHYELWLKKRAINPLNKRLIYFTNLTNKDKTEYLFLVKADKSKLILINL